MPNGIIRDDANDSDNKNRKFLIIKMFPKDCVRLSEEMIILRFDVISTILPLNSFQRQQR